MTVSRRRQRAPGSGSRRCGSGLLSSTPVAVKAGEGVSSAWLELSTQHIAIGQLRSIAGRRRYSSAGRSRSEEHTSELQSRQYLVCRLLLEKKNTTTKKQ